MGEGPDGSVGAFMLDHPPFVRAFVMGDCGGVLLSHTCVQYHQRCQA